MSSDLLNTDFSGHQEILSEYLCLLRKFQQYDLLALPLPLDDRIRLKVLEFASGFSSNLVKRAVLLAKYPHLAQSCCGRAAAAADDGQLEVSAGPSPFAALAHFPQEACYATS